MHLVYGVNTPLVIAPTSANVGAAKTTNGIIERNTHAKN